MILSDIIRKIKKNAFSPSAFFLQLFITLGVIGYLGVDLFQDESLEHHNRMNIKAISEQIELMLKDHLRVVETLAKNPLTIDSILKRKNTTDTVLMLNTAKEVSNSHVVYIIGDDGMVISSSDIAGLSIIGYKYNFRPYYKLAISGKSCIFPAVGIVSKIRGLHLSCPVYDRNGEKIIGVVALKLNISVIEELLKNREQKIVLLSPDNIIFSSNRPEWLFHSTRELSSQTLKNLKKTKQFGDFKIRPLPFNMERKNFTFEGETYQTVIHDLPINGWRMISCQNKSADVPLKSFYQFIIIISISVTGGLSTLIFFLVLNINRTKKAQIMLRHIEERYSNIFRNAAIGIFQSTPDGRFLDANPEMAKIMGCSNADNIVEALNNTGDRIFASPESRREYYRLIQKTKQVKGFETQLIRKDGKVIWVSLSSRIVKDRENGDSVTEGFCMDISERIKMEKEEAERQEQLVLADRMAAMGILTSGVAHEINNPNTFINANAQMLSDFWKEGAIILDEYFEANGDFIIGGLPYETFRTKLPTICSHIVDGSRRIARIVKELRNYSRNDQPWIAEPVDINVVIQSAMVLLAGMIKKSTHNFVLVPEPDLPAVNGVFQRFEQVVVNIVQNACQALPHRECGIFVSSFHNKAESTVCIICKDEGIGIEEKNLKRVIDPFFTTKRDSGGTGLGLSITSKIVRELNGAMDIESCPGRGTKVTLSFPLCAKTVEQMKIIKENT